MPKPFANSPQFTGDILESYIFGIQTGQNKGSDTPTGLSQMKFVTAQKLRSFMKEGMGSTFNYRGAYSTTPTDLAVGDAFYAQTSFSTFTADHLYAWNGTSWDDITNIFTQYAQQSQVDSMDTRLTNAEDLLDAMGDGIIVKGECTYAELIAIADPEVGWEYWVTDRNAFYLYSETDGWIAIDNGIVQTITDGDTTHAPSADAVYDAFSDVKNALEDSEQRIENLEQAVSGSLVQTNVLTDPPSMANVRTITNANTILPWALLKRVGARSVAWNQAVKTLRASSTVSGITFTNNGDGSISLSGTPSAYAIAVVIDADSIPVGHKVLIIGGTPTVRLRGSSALAYADCDQGNGIIITAQIDTEALIACQFPNTTTAVNATVKPQCFDLTAMGEYDSTKTDAQNIANFKVKYPALFYPYNAGGIIPLNPSGFKVIGSNMFNKATVTSGKAINPDGTLFSDPGRSVSDYIRVQPSGTYYFKNLVSSSMRKSLGIYDINKNFISTWGLYDASSTVSMSDTLPAYAYYIRAVIHDVNLNDAMINVGSSALPFKAYSETTLDTSFTSDYKYVNPSCHDYSENVLVDGQKKREEHKVVGQVDLGDLSFTYSTGTWAGNYFQAVLPNGKYGGAGVVANALCSNGYLPITRSQMSSYSDMVFCFDSNGTNTLLQLKNSSKSGSDIVDGHCSWLEGVTLDYELATPSTPTLHDPIPNFPSEDGTTITAITPQTELVNAIDVPSTIAYMTKISS